MNVRWKGGIFSLRVADEHQQRVNVAYLFQVNGQRGFMDDINISSRFND